MSQGPAIWALGLATSAVLHLGAGAGLMAALQPEAVENQPVPESRLNVQAQQVSRSEATQRMPQSEAAEPATPDATALATGAIPQSSAVPQAAPIEAARLQSPQSRAQIATPTAPQMGQAAQVQPDAAAAQPSSPATTAAAVQAPKTSVAVPVRPAIENARPNAPAAIDIAASTAPQPAQAIAEKPQTQLAQATALQPVFAPSKPTSSPKVIPTALSPAAVAPDLPDTTTATETPAPSVSAPAQQPDAIKGTATLAFPGKTDVDPVSLAAFQSFTQPGQATGQDVRDSLSALLSIPCARMQVIFDPDTTTLQLTGHVPTADQRAPLLAALQSEMGSDITVTDNLLVLPAPQCGALSGIADVGLPQSTDQITNPMIVGADTHARAFRFIEGQPLIIDMGGADYPAYVYLDYFDANGNVIHLSPNDRAPLTRVDAKAPVTFGARSTEDDGLLVQIGPPYGEEIAAAFAASHPLYEGLRPIVEPADGYLAWMQSRVAEARAQHADFKGEWVYFFVTTAAE